MNFYSTFHIFYYYFAELNVSEYKMTHFNIKKNEIYKMMFGYIISFIFYIIFLFPPFQWCRFYAQSEINSVYIFLFFWLV